MRKYAISFEWCAIKWSYWVWAALLKKSDSKRSTKRPVKKAFSCINIVDLFTMNWESVVLFLFWETSLIFGDPATVCNKILMVFIHVHYSQYMEIKKKMCNDTCFFKKKGRHVFVYFLSAGQYNGGRQFITTFPTGLPLGIALYKILFLWLYRNRT